MAVAAHVSKVSKDYSPYGYSIMESSCSTLVTFPTGTDGSFGTILIADDADVFIESIVLLSIDAIAQSDTNFVTIRVSSFASGGTDPVGHMATVNTTVAAGIALVADTQYKQEVLSPVVERGRQLMWNVEPATAHATTASKQFSVYVRYRRKA